MIALPPYELHLPPELASTAQASGLRFVVTGARGWLGRATLDLLESALEAQFRDRVVAFGSSPGSVQTRRGSSVPVRDLRAAAELAPHPSVLLHYAYLTKDRLVDGVPVESYRRQNAAIRETVLGWLRPLGITGVFLPSAGAVYSVPEWRGNGGKAVADSDSRADYGRDKLADEAQFAAACRSVGARLLTARIFSLSGPHINKHGAYVLAAIILAILKGEPISLRARKAVYRSYVGVADLVAIALGWLLRSEAPEQLTIDAASPEIVEVGELARRAAAVLGAPGTPIHRPAFDARDADRYAGDPSALLDLARKLRVPLAGIDEQIRQTAAYLAETVGAAA